MRDLVGEFGLSYDRSGVEFGLSCDRSGVEFGLSCEMFGKCGTLMGYSIAMAEAW